jgi:hypothetical protein
MLSSYCVVGKRASPINLRYEDFGSFCSVSSEEARDRIAIVAMNVQLMRTLEMESIPFSVVRNLSLKKSENMRCLLDCDGIFIRGCGTGDVCAC